MSKLNKIFTKLPVPVQNRSGFDLSHEHLFTAKVGSLIPALSLDCLPGDKFSLGTMLQCQLPPMATDFYGRVDVRLEAFFCPYRLVYKGWESFISGINSNTGEGAIPANSYLPYYEYEASTKAKLGPGSLADYLGFKLSTNLTPSQLGRFQKISYLPFAVYHKIWDDWYRDSRIQKPSFAFAPQTTAAYPPFRLPYEPISPTGTPKLTNPLLYDGADIFNLRQRNWAKDYFTTASLKPQFGSESSLSFGVQIASGSTTGTGSFTIAALRAANSLQKFLERNNIAGSRYIDQIKAQFGVVPSDAVMQRPVYLGGTTINVYNKSVYAQADVTAQSPANPFTSVASKYGNSSAIGDGSLFDNFEVKEHGMLMVMFSLVPHAYYSTGVERKASRVQLADFAFPLLAGVGDDTIFAGEVGDTFSGQSYADDTFGYCQRYADYKFQNDKVSGLLRDGQSLSAFALTRAITGNQTPKIGTNFLTIPTTAMDDVSAVASSLSNYGCWVDMFFNLKAIRPLPVYSLPTLGDEKDVHSVLMDVGGTRL